MEQCFKRMASRRPIKQPFGSRFHRLRPPRPLANPGLECMIWLSLLQRAITKGHRQAHCTGTFRKCNPANRLDGFRVINSQPPSAKTVMAVQQGRALLDKLGFTPAQCVKGRASIADLFSPDQRCGIYVLHFSTGEFYAGQATDVTHRYIQHRNTHQDIEKISFKAISPDCLDEEERSVIWQLEQWGWPLRNVVFTSFPKGESDFDLIMPLEEQGQWLENPGFVDDKGERLVDPDLRRKFPKSYERFIRTPYADDIVDAVRTYVRVGVPAIRRGEVSFWGLSCMPNHGIRTYARVNIFWQEVFAAFVHQKELWFSVYMALSPLQKALGNDLQWLRKRHAAVEHTNRRYEPGGQDQTSFEIPAVAAIAFITDPAVASAIRLLNLRLMRKGPCNWGRLHCMDLADRVIETEWPQKAAANSR